MLPGKLSSILRQQVGWYLFWASPWVIILLLSSVLNGYAAPLAQASATSSVVKPDNEPLKTPLLPQATATPEATSTPSSSQSIAPADIPLPIFLPLIIKSPPFIICVLDIGASDCVVGTLTPTNTPFGTPPGFGTPTNTPLPTETKPPSPTATPTVFIKLFPNGDFEDGHQIWEEFSSQNHDIIEEENSDDLPTLPGIGVDGDWAAWLGGDDNEHSYIRQTVTIPNGGSVLFYDYYLQSYDQCGSELNPPRIFDRGGIKINGFDITGDLPGCTHELCEPKDDARTWNRVFIPLDFFGRPGSRITVEFWAITDGSNPSSLFIDNVGFTNTIPEDAVPLTSTGLETQAGIQTRRSNAPPGPVEGNFLK